MRARAMSLAPPWTVVEVDRLRNDAAFPFVTNMYGYETGIAITNTSSEGGMPACSRSPAPMLLRMIWK